VEVHVFASVLVKKIDAGADAAVGVEKTEPNGTARGRDRRITVIEAIELTFGGAIFSTVADGFVPIAIGIDAARAAGIGYGAPFGIDDNRPALGGTAGFGACLIGELGVNFRGARENGARQAGEEGEHSVNLFRSFSEICSQFVNS
jgi:hypothetical protein